MRQVLDLLAGAIDDEAMHAVNNQVDVTGKRPEDVTLAFLRERGMLTL